MNILFITLFRVNDLNERGIYTDLIRTFTAHGHNVVIVTPEERRYRNKTGLFEYDGVSILKVQTFNLQKTNLIEKGIGTLLLEYQFKRAIKKYLADIFIDLVIYSTPPITLISVIKYIKKKHKAKSYLLLKDIFPQNAVDLGMMNANGFVCKYLRKKESQLYSLSDAIGCMSPANVSYLLSRNPEISSYKVEVNPNSIQLSDNYISDCEKAAFRLKYKLPENKTIFIYGGNLGKPQGLAFLVEVIKSNYQNPTAFFLIVGTGTEYNKLSTWFDKNKPPNARLLPGVEKQEYDHLVQSCDIGLILLDNRFTIPNFPSRLLSYLEYRLPVICATDSNTDIGTIALEAGFGYSVLHGDIDSFNRVIDKILNSNADHLKYMGDQGYHYLVENYLVEKTYAKIISKL